MNKKITLLSLLMVVFSFFQSLSVMQAQDLAFEWVKKADTSSLSRGISIDGQNNVYMASTVEGVPRLFKYDGAGNIMWTLTVAEVLSIGSIAELTSVQADAYGNVFVTGHFNNTIVLNNHNDTLTAVGSLATSLNGYLVKYDTAGNFQWAKVFGKGARQSYVNDVTIDKWGDISVIGRYIGTGDFNPNVDTFLMSNGSTNSSLHNIYVAKLDSAGAFKWAKQFQGSSGSSTGFSIENDKWGNLITAGSFRGTMDFDPSPNTAFRSVTSGVDAFITKLDSAGNFKWVRHITGQATSSSSAREIFDIALDSLGAVYATGYFSNSVILNSNNTTVLAVNSFDALVVKYDSAGTYQWDAIYAGFASDLGRSIVVDEYLNVYAAGTFSDSVDFDPGVNTYYLKTKNNPNSYYADIYWTKLSSTGNFIWAKTVGGKQVEYLEGIAIDGSNNLYTLGYFQSDTIDFNPDPNYEYLLHVIPPPIPSFPFPNNEFFLHKMSCSDTSSSVLDTLVCSELIFDNVIYNTNGTFVHILRGAYGCDSTVTIHLTIEEVNAMITVNGFELGTVLPHATYQWLKNGVLIAGATNATYNVTENADYQVIVSSTAGCIDTSAVYKVTNATSIWQHEWSNQVSIHPNPVKDKLFIESPGEVQYSILSIDGKLQHSVRSFEKYIDCTNWVNGVYFVQIFDKDGGLIKVEKFVKQ